MPIKDSSPNSNSDHTGSWAQYQLLVLAELNRADARLTQIEVTLSKMQTEFAVMKTKVIIISSAITVVLSSLFSFALTFFK